MTRSSKSVNPLLNTEPAKNSHLSNSDEDNFSQRSSLYKEFLAERDEILRHKWIESEKKGCDIGFERALLDWIRKHREKWRVTRGSKSP
jgi:hypothetical protein